MKQEEEIYHHNKVKVTRAKLEDVCSRPFRTAIWRIAKEAGCGVKAVDNAFKRHPSLYNKWLKKPKEKRKYPTKARLVSKEVFEMYVKEHIFSSVGELAQHFEVSDTTIRNWLKESNIVLKRFRRGTLTTVTRNTNVGVLTEHLLKVRSKEITVRFLGDKEICERQYNQLLEKAIFFDQKKEQRQKDILHTLERMSVKVALAMESSYLTDRLKNELFELEILKLKQHKETFKVKITDEELNKMIYDDE